MVVAKLLDLPVDDLHNLGTQRVEHLAKARSGRAHWVVSSSDSSDLAYSARG
jgi:hypothetical protein